MTNPKTDNTKPCAPIPLAVLKPLAATAWKADDYSLTKFARLIDSHRRQDEASGVTCWYSTTAPGNEGLTQAELKPMLEAGAIAPHHVSKDCGRINQHLAHSLDQFYAEVTRSWRSHLERMASIAGTAADRIER